MSHCVTDLSPRFIVMARNPQGEALFIGKFCDLMDGLLACARLRCIGYRPTLKRIPGM